jgi:hypothetical protein
MWQPSSEEKTAGFMIKKESERRKRRSLTRDGIIIIYHNHTTNDALERRDIRRHLFCFGFFLSLPPCYHKLLFPFGQFLAYQATLMKAASSFRFIISFSFVDEGAERRG